MVKLPDGNYSIPDSVLLGLWEDMVNTGRNRVVFYSGGVTSTADWLAWMKSPTNFPVIVVDVQERVPVFLAWLNSMADRMCFAHFCGIGVGRYQPVIADSVMRFWDTFKDAEGRPFRAILAMIPEENKSAIRLAEIAGFKFLGVIPGLCDIANENRTTGGTLGYYIPPQEG